MTFAVPELVQALLKKDCEVEMEPLDAQFSDRLITHLYAPTLNLDIDIFILEDTRIKVEVWRHDPNGVAWPANDMIFDLNAPESVESIADFLLEHLHGSLVKIRFQRRKEDVDQNETKTEGSPQ